MVNNTMDYLSNLFKGRLSVGNFWVGLLLPMIICVPIGFVPNYSTSPIYNIIEIPLVIVLFVYYMSLIIRRLHDHNKSGWFGLAVYLPIYGLYVLFLLFYMGGGEEANKYGISPNKKIDWKRILGLRE
jgi:uncharacterized membrane protein YhaH (DUF805 family)